MSKEAILNGIRRGLNASAVIGGIANSRAVVLRVEEFGPVRPCQGDHLTQRHGGGEEKKKKSFHKI